MLAALDDAAAHAGDRTTTSMLMVELGDLREGIARRRRPRQPCGSSSASRSLRLAGLGANLACQNGVVPDDREHGRPAPARRADRGAARHLARRRLRRQLRRTWTGRCDTRDSAGSTSSASARRSCSASTPAPHPDPRAAHRRLHPGRRGHRGRRRSPHSRGETRRRPPSANRRPAPAAGPCARRSWPSAARTSTSTACIRPTGITVLGMSSDHLVLDVGDHPTRSATSSRFGLGYGALVRAMTSPFVTRAEVPRRRRPPRLSRPAGRASPRSRRRRPPRCSRRTP